MLFASLMNVVLVTIIGEVENATIQQGESARFKCQITDKSDRATVFWMVDNTQYNCTAISEGQVDRNGCYTSDTTTNILLLRDTKSLAVEEHQVQCIVEQNLPSMFLQDESFEEGFNSVAKSGTLKIDSGIKIML